MTAIERVGEPSGDPGTRIEVRRAVGYRTRGFDRGPKLRIEEYLRAARLNARTTRDGRELGGRIFASYIYPQFRKSVPGSA
jgi:hypothetical protein